MRRGDREPRPQRRHAARGGVERQHRRAGTDARRPRLRHDLARPGDPQRAHPRPLVDRHAPLEQAPPQPEREPRRLNRRASGTSTPRRNNGESHRARTAGPSSGTTRARRPRPMPDRAGRRRRRRRLPPLRSPRRGSRRASRRRRGSAEADRHTRSAHQASTPGLAPGADRVDVPRRTPRRRRGRARRRTARRSDGSEVQSVSQNPPLRPLGPWPQRLGLEQHDAGIRRSVPRRARPSTCRCSPRRAR